MWLEASRCIGTLKNLELSEERNEAVEYNAIICMFATHGKLTETHLFKMLQFVSKTRKQISHMLQNSPGNIKLVHIAFLCSDHELSTEHLLHTLKQQNSMKRKQLNKLATRYMDVADESKDLVDDLTSDDAMLGIRRHLINSFLTALTQPIAIVHHTCHLSHFFRALKNANIHYLSRRGGRRATMLYNSLALLAALTDSTLAPQLPRHTRPQTQQVCKILQAELDMLVKTIIEDDDKLNKLYDTLSTEPNFKLEMPGTFEKLPFFNAILQMQQYAMNNDEDRQAACSPLETWVARGAVALLVSTHLLQPTADLHETIETTIKHWVPVSSLVGSYTRTEQRSNETHTGEKIQYNRCLLEKIQTTPSPLAQMRLGELARQQASGFVTTLPLLHCLSAFKIIRILTQQVLDDLPAQFPDTFDEWRTHYQHNTTPGRTGQRIFTPSELDHALVKKIHAYDYDDTPGDKLEKSLLHDFKNIMHLSDPVAFHYTQIVARPPRPT